jgi:hypothetical protein
MSDNYNYIVNVVNTTDACIIDAQTLTTGPGLMQVDITGLINDALPSLTTVGIAIDQRFMQAGVLTSFEYIVSNSGALILLVRKRCMTVISCSIIDRIVCVTTCIL